MSIWDTSYSNDLGRLCQLVDKGPTSTGQHTKVTDTFRVIRFKNIPRDQYKGITLTKVFCKFRTQKEHPNCTQITIMGNRVVYASDAGTKTASLDLCKLMMNSVLLHKGAKFITYNICNYYLATPLDYPEYVKSSSPTSHKSSLTSITSTTMSTKAGYISKPATASMVYLNPAA